ncbi:MAG: hypothetical protein H6710_21285 [Myxococcales bacterium]|nr:hypothetical protein [Myxococcales bacterium]MCB9700523.1 hypothetical protein [Myxococcales bacterium]
MLRIESQRPKPSQIDSIAARIKAAGGAVETSTTLNKLAIDKVVNRLVELIPMIVWLHQGETSDPTAVVDCGSNSCQNFHTACTGETIDLPGCGGEFTPCTGLSQCDIETCAAHSCSETHDCGQNSGGECSGELVCSDTHGPGTTETADSNALRSRSGAWYSLIARLAESRPSLDELGQTLTVHVPAPKTT